MDVITYNEDGSQDLRIPGHEARRCAVYRDPETSEVSAESYLLCDLLSCEASLEATIISNGTTLAMGGLLSFPDFAPPEARWALTPAGRERLAWEASLLRERWRADPR